MGFLSAIGQKLNSGANWFGTKVGGALTNVGSKVAGIATKGADLASKGAMISAFVAPEIAPVLGAVSAGLKGVQSVAEGGVALGQALQAGNLRDIGSAGQGLVDKVKTVSQPFVRRGDF